LIPGNTLWIIVVDHLRQGLSPAQIASTLARMPDPVRLSYETIYTALYTMPRGHLRSSLLSLMRRRHRARRPHRGKDGRSKPSIPDMTLIDQRPIEVQMRLIPGHWEGNLIIGKGNLSQVGTLVERTTLFVALVKLDSSKADVTAEAFTKILNRFDSQMRRSMTYDQGSEMPPQGLNGKYGSRRLLRPPARALGTGHQREYQRPAPSILAERDRSLAVLAGATGRHRLAT
jgi:IS30 family transposase